MNNFKKFKLWNSVKHSHHQYKIKQGYQLKLRLKNAYTAQIKTKLNGMRALELNAYKILLVHKFKSCH